MPFRSFFLSGCFHSRENFTFIDPYLDADAAIGGMGFSSTIVNVGTQGVQGNAAVTIRFGTGNFSTAKTAGAGDLDSRCV